MKLFLISLLFTVLAFSGSFAQHGHSQDDKPDPRYSVFGPPTPSTWKFQLSHLRKDGESSSAFNLYKKNQRDKTIFLTLINNGLDNIRQYRVRQL